MVPRFAPGAGCPFMLATVAIEAGKSRQRRVGGGHLGGD